MGQGIDLLGSMLRVLPERTPPAIDPSRLKRLLVIKLSSIGDVIHALPVASALKRSDPSLRITWVVEQWTAPLLWQHPAIDRIVVFPTLVKWPSHPLEWLRELRKALRDLRAESYDVAVDLQGLARSAAVSLLSRSPLRIARQGQREGAHLVSFGVPLPRAPIHAVDEYLHVAGVLGATIQPVTFALQVSAEASAAVDGMLADHGVARETPLIVVNPSASKRWKSWPPEHWARVADALADSGRVMLVGSADRTRLHADIARRTRHRPVDVTGQTTLSELVALLERAALHMAPDTGTVHIAAALGRPVVTIYGPTPPFRVGPYGQADGVVYHGDLCGPGCPAYCLRRRRCLSATTPDEVIERARAVLGAAVERAKQ